MKDLKVSLFDMHAHINFLEVTPEEAIQEALDNGVKKIVTIGTCPKDLSEVLELSKVHAPYVYCTLGIHPHDAKDYTQEAEDFIRKEAVGDRVIALGEMGLDFYYNESSPEIQKEKFYRQMEMAADLKLPVQIHTRDADRETVEVLKDFRGKVFGVIHCFTGTPELARQCLDLDYNLSISGVVTFKNAEALRSIVKETPLERLQVETDAPFLAPVPMRGKKNRPSYVTYVAEKVAELKSVSLEQLAEQTCRNAYEIFPKLKN